MSPSFPSLAKREGMRRCHERVPRARPNAAGVLVPGMGRSGHQNPLTPAGFKNMAMDLHLSPAKLKYLHGTQDLSQVTSMEIRVNTRENTLGNFGACLPKLVQLKLNNSRITSVRDLGTSLSHLQVLWMSRCCLQDLDGISSFSSLKELYVSYNNLSELSQLSMLENLLILDVEGNNLEDLVQIQYLGLCSQLHTLSLEGNPICLHPHPNATQDAEYSYRAAVRELIPQLRYLDDVRAEEEGPSCSSSMGEDWALIRDSIRAGSSMEAAAVDGEATSAIGCRPSSSKRPGSSFSSPFRGSGPLTGFRPLSGSGPRSMSVLGGSRALSPPPGSRPGSADSDPDSDSADPGASALTHGAGRIVFCGNPVQALRTRRENLKTAPTASTSTSHHPPIHVPEHTYDLEEPGPGERTDVFAELRAWRKKHAKRLRAIERERSPQVLKIDHSDAEEDESGGEQDPGVVKSRESDEEDGDTEAEERRADGPSSASSCSSFQSLSPDLSHLSPQVAQLSLAPVATLSPSPPLSSPAASQTCRQPGIRTRRLRIGRAGGGGSPLVARSPEQALEAGQTRASPSIPQWVQEGARPKVPLGPLTTREPHPPSTSPLVAGLRDHRLEMDVSSLHTATLHQTLRPLDRPAITRPHTAKAALQKHLQRHILQPNRGRSDPD